MLRIANSTTLRVSHNLRYRRTSADVRYFWSIDRKSSQRLFFLSRCNRKFVKRNCKIAGSDRSLIQLYRKRTGSIVIVSRFLRTAVFNWISFANLIILHDAEDRSRWKTCRPLIFKRCGSANKNRSRSESRVNAACRFFRKRQATVQISRRFLFGKQFEKRSSARCAVCLEGPRFIQLEIKKNTAV